MKQLLIFSWNGKSYQQSFKLLFKKIFLNRPSKLTGECLRCVAGVIFMKPTLFSYRNDNITVETFKPGILKIAGFAFTTAILLLLSCSKEKEVCGPSKEYNLLTTDFAANYYYSNNKVYFQYSTPVIENVCTDEHVKVQAFITLRTNLQPVVSSKVYGSYALFFAPNIPLDKTNDVAPDQKQYVYFGDFGLKQSFGTGPGSFYVTAEILFDSLGDFIKDSTYFTEIFKGINLNVYYSDFKQ